MKVKDIKKLFLEKGYKISDNEPFASGREGKVYKAIKENKIYAIKIYDGINKERQVRYEQEIKNIKNLDNEHVINVCVNGLLGDKKINYVIMPFYSSDFRKVICEERDYFTLFNYIIQLCDVILYLHEKQIWHRDLKPENILINNDALVFTDFGIAHFKDSTLTKESDLLANRNYAAPEQRRKGATKQITGAADIYALGLIINECFTKQNPHGINYLKIRNIYPFLFELDELVDRMREQDAG